MLFFYSPDVTGCQDGSVRMWEWSHSQAVQNVRPAGVFAKVNRVRFTSQGNKFGACDGDGNVSLWQASNASSPFFVSNKSVMDRTFYLHISNAYMIYSIV